MSTTGICPKCELPGAFAQPCDTPACLDRGYHRVPTAALQSLDKGLVDPVIGQKFGRFLVIDHLGSGGVGSVYLALSQPGGRKVALKVLAGHGRPVSKADLARFRQEAAALARVRHPNIVSLVDFGETGGRAYLVMDYVARGRTLADEMKKPSDLFPLAARLDVLRQVLAALSAAHAQHVVHRDIKPANIMLQSVEDESWQVRIVDFGLAKFIDDGSSTALAAGTPAYMAPEQMTRRGIGPWTDWYAVAVIAFEMLTGQRPFPRGTPQQVLFYKMDPAFDWFAALATPLPTPARAFFERALDVEPETRYREANAFTSALEAAFRAVDPLVPESRRDVAQDTAQHWVPAAALSAADGMRTLPNSMSSSTLLQSSPRLSDPPPTVADSDLAVAPTPPPMLVQSVPVGSRPAWVDRSVRLLWLVPLAGLLLLGLGVLLVSRPKKSMVVAAAPSALDADSGATPIDVSGAPSGATGNREVAEADSVATALEGRADALSVLEVLAPEVDGGPGLDTADASVDQVEAEIGDAQRGVAAKAAAGDTATRTPTASSSKRARKRRHSLGQARRSRKPATRTATPAKVEAVKSGDGRHAPDTAPSAPAERAKSVDDIHMELWGEE